MFSVSAENELVFGGELWVFSINIHTTFDKITHPKKLLYLGRFAPINNKPFLAFKTNQHSSDEVRVVYDDKGYPLLLTKSHIISKTKSGIFDKISDKRGVSKTLVFLKKYREYCMVENPEWFI